MQSDYESKRNKYDICAEILELCLNKPQRHTSIVYRTNINHHLLIAYLEILEKAKLLERTEIGAKTTKKGQKWVEKFREINLSSPLFLSNEG